ncbi:hypothetical protein Y032_0399g742 [Ancylostoma ceylanicum]|uniref:Uncharacterized protein n=1 Tax=Ancylostoma ceylanicum TaxID=53326 RepID=A0A016RRR0_9BILA|nr:hypothetical protein Y032_0399g742 [Ancylostoma ceylanicum]
MYLHNGKKDESGSEETPKIPAVKVIPAVKLTTWKIRHFILDDLIINVKRETNISSPDGVVFPSCSFFRRSTVSLFKHCSSVDPTSVLMRLLFLTRILFDLRSRQNDTSPPSVP